MISTVVLTPALSLAKDNGIEIKESVKLDAKLNKELKKENKENEDQNKDNKKEEGGEKSCLRAFGHLVAPGFIKINGQASIEENCFLPFGIFRKLHGNATTTPDRTAPVITNIHANVGVTMAQIDWKTNENANSTVFYGINSTNLSTGSNALVKDHHVIISGLSASTTYVVMLQSKDKSGNTATSSQFSITTLSQPVDTTPPQIQNVVGIVASTSVQVGWQTNESANGTVFYSGVSPVTASSSSLGTTTFSTNHLFTVPNLTASTTYFFKVQSVDGSNNVGSSAEFSLKTLSL